jgi:hypothetical protein
MGDKHSGTAVVRKRSSKTTHKVNTHSYQSQHTHLAAVAPWYHQPSPLVEQRREGPGGASHQLARILAQYLRTYIDKNTSNNV